MATLVSTARYDAQINSLLGFDEQAELEFSIAAAPESHPVVAQTGGVRKARWARQGMGKRGGIRVIYYWVVSAEIVVMLTAYPKNKKEDLSDAEKKVIRRAVEALKGDSTVAAGQRHRRRTA